MLQLAPIFQSGMILQRGKPAAVWGTADPDAVVSVAIQGRTAEAAADGNGAWRAVLPALAASESETLTVRCGGSRVMLEDVAVGEVWLAGGQSNMEFHLRYEKHRGELTGRPDEPRLRFFDVPEVCFDGQTELFDYSRMGLWRKASAADLDYFCAAGYYFQRELMECLDVPVGIVGCNWGGTVSAAWMDPATVDRVGKRWMDEYRAHLPELQSEDYWAGQRACPAMDRGDPFGNIFNETIMPRTLTGPELEVFLRQTPEWLSDLFNHFLAWDIPGSLYEHMVKTVAPFAVRGVLWYQGESDDEKGHADLYADMLTGLIGDWRALWGEDLPFLVVQLPGFRQWMANPPGNNYMEIRACQERVSKTVPGAYLCSISDVGEEFDIHPKDKKTVGHRLALLARGHVYGEDILCDPPLAVSAEREGAAVTVTFANAGGFVIQGDALNGMEVTVGGRPVQFSAAVRGERLVLTLAEDVPGPLKLAFARSCWYQVNLYNGGGVPAVPFEFELD